MARTKTVYYVDIVDMNVSKSIVSVYHSENSDEAHDVANKWNDGLNNPKCIYYTEANLRAEVYEIEEPIKEEKEMKKYTINDYETFSREALDMPPIEQFEDGTIDEEQWYEDNKIIIIKGNHQMELDYNADNVNEIDAALREMYEVEMDIRSATTGNTVGSQYRPAELKDILRVAIQNDWEDHGYKNGSFTFFIREFVKAYDDITNIIGVYDDIIYKDVKWYNEICKCNFGKLDMLSLRHIDRAHIQKAIEDLVCTDRELLVGYDNCNRCSDITFIMDHTFKQSGELIGWFYGEQDEKYIGELIADYKKKLFGEV